jgi:hypothetical protein
MNKTASIKKVSISENKNENENEQNKFTFCFFRSKSVLFTQYVCNVNLGLIE